MKIYTARARDALKRGLHPWWMPAVLVLYVLWVGLGAASSIQRLTGLFLLIGSRLLLVHGCWHEVRSAPIRYQRTWQLLGAAVLLWVLADGTTAGFLILGGVRPSAPSIWHWLRSAGCFAFLLGFTLYPILPPERFSKLRAVFDTLTLSLTAAALFWSIIAGPILRIRLFPAVPFLWESVLILFDTILILLLLRLSILVESSRDNFYSYMLMAVSFMLFLGGDLSSGLLDLDVLQMKGLRECFGTAGNLLLVLSFSGYIKQGTGKKPLFSSTMQRKFDFWMPIVLAYLSVGYVLVLWYLTDRIDWIGLGFSAAIVTALVSRQGIAAGQYEMRQYSTLVNTVSDPAFICRVDGRMRLTNPAAQILIRLAGLEPGNLMLQDLFLAEVPCDEILLEAQHGGWTGLVSVPEAGGKYSLSLQPVREEVKSPTLLAGSAHDLTDLLEREAALHQALQDVDRTRAALVQLNTELEEKVSLRTEELQQSVQKLAQLNQELKQLDRMKNEFVTLVSHELRSPLTNIETGVELALYQLRKTREAPLVTLRKVQGETHRLEHFIEIILDISALDAGKVRFQPSPLDLVSELNEVLERFSETNLAGRIFLDVEESLPLVLAEERSLQSVMYHVLDNAAKYAPEGQVRIAVARSEEGIQVIVEDEGPGIPEDEQERVFELFHRLDSSDSREIYGYGLGLSAAQRFLEAMSGWIRIENSVTSTGTQVVFWLPAVS